MQMIRQDCKPLISLTFPYENRSFSKAGCTCNRDWETFNLLLPKPLLLPLHVSICPCIIVPSHLRTMTHRTPCNHYGYSPSRADESSIDSSWTNQNLTSRNMYDNWGQERAWWSQLLAGPPTAEDCGDLWGCVLHHKNWEQRTAVRRQRRHTWRGAGTISRESQWLDLRHASRPYPNGAQ